MFKKICNYYAYENIIARRVARLNNKYFLDALEKSPTDLQVLKLCVDFYISKLKPKISK